MLAWQALVLAAVPAMAQTVTRLEGETRLIASDNPFVLAGVDNEAIAAELVARPEIRWTLGPATTAELTGVAAYRRYSRRYGDFLTGRAEATAAHRASEYLSFDLAFSFARELPADALTESIDFSIDPRSVRERSAGRGSIAWSPDAYTSFTGAAGAERLRYPGSMLLSAANAYHFDGAAVRRISPVTSVGVRATATQTDIIGIAGLNAHAVYATVAHRIGPHLEGSADIGVEWSDYDLPGNRRARLSGHGRLCYRPDPLDFCLTASRQSEVSGFGGLLNEEHVGVTASRRVGPRSRITVLGDVRRADLGLVASRSSAVRLGVAYRHRWTERLSFIGGVDYLARKFLSGGRNDAIVAQVGIAFGRED